MNKKYIAGAILIGAAFIGGGWLFQTEGTTPGDQSTGSQVYSTPAAQTPTQKPSGGGDVNF